MARGVLSGRARFTYVRRLRDARWQAESLRRWGELKALHEPHGAFRSFNGNGKPSTWCPGCGRFIDLSSVWSEGARAAWESAERGG